MLCTRCQKRTAVVFITAMQGNDKKEEGLCLVCAKKLNIPQVNEYMKQMGIDEDDLEAFADSVDGIANDIDGDSFENGGTSSMLPNFMKNIFSGDNSFMKEMEKRIEKMASNSENSSDDNIADEKDEDKKETEKGPISRKKKFKYLNAYCTNLSEKARNGEIDHIIGRDSEIARTIQILSRRQKNNPCLIGEPGVGKTAIAEGIAQKIEEGKVPFHIADKQVFLLDLTSLVAGTQFRGQFESRIKGLLDEVKEAGNIILFIDEVHRLVGVGDNDGSMNAANILKPSLSRGEIQVIGATTFTEYRNFIEKDSALERRFQPVTVNEPSIAESYEILLGLREYYEKHHKVKISDENLKMCVVLSERYINDRFLPDKAIDLLDECCACRSIRSAELAKISELNKKIKLDEKNISEIGDADDIDFEALANAKAELLKDKAELEEIEANANNLYVDEKDLAYVVELWSGIPASKIEASEFKKISALEEAFKKRIIGQDDAVSAVSKAIKRSRIQLEKKRRPASFIFVGPTGVGKTELVKVIAEELFDGQDPLIRFDMTEFMEKHSVSRLIGSPPGYVGYEEAGQLTEKVRRHPYSVVLFDEIEKAHPDVMNILLQILDEGKIRDSQGRNINFENTIICMTSNAGSSDKSAILGFNKTENEMSKEKAMKALSDFLRPEFLGRIDEVIVFNNLTKEDYAQIASLMLEEMKEPLEEKKITFKYDKKATSYIAEKSFGGKFGARDIRKFIRTDVLDPVAEKIVSAGDNQITAIKLTTRKNELCIDTNLDKEEK